MSVLNLVVPELEYLSNTLASVLDLEITIVDNSEYQKLINFINREDPKAFITIYNVSSMQYQPKIRG